MDFIQPRQVNGRAGQEQAERTVGNRHSERPAGARQQQALGQHLPEKTPDAGAERGADGEFPFPGRSAREQQIRNVDAADQKNQRHRGEHQLEAVARTTGDLILKRNHRREEIDFLRCLAGQTRLRRVQFGQRLSLGSARPQPGDARKIEIAQGVQLVRSHRKRLPQLRPVGGDGHPVELADLRKVEVGGEYSDDFVRLPIEQDLAPDDAWVGGKSAFPELVAQHDDAVAPGLVLFLEERAAQLGVRSEHREKGG